MKNVLVIDDDAALRRSLQLQLKVQGFDTRTAGTAKDGLELLKKDIFDVLFLDLTLPDKSGLDVLQEVKILHPDLSVIIISGRQDMDSTITAIKFGAFDYLRKPFDMDAVILILTKLKHQRNLIPLSVEGDPPQTEDVIVEHRGRELVGSAPAMLDILKQVGLLSRNRVPVLILGESGTGKEVIARALHRVSTPELPFVAINCSAVVPTLLESELFGYEKGAFTGADKQVKGKLEAAGGGIVFFDEIGEMPFDLQAKLLRVLQERSFERVGGTDSVSFDARTIFATHRDLLKLVKDGVFRQDLYYRIAVAQLTIPPLRERREDIKPVAEYLLGRLSETEKTGPVSISSDAMSLLTSYDWPGNVRELENVLSRSVALSYSGVLTEQDIHLESESVSPSGEELDMKDGPFLVRPLSEIEQEYIAKALLETSWNISKTARLLNISPTTLRKKINDYSLSRI